MSAASAGPGGTVPTWHEVAKSDDVVEGAPYPLEISGVAIALYRIGDELYAIGDICPHQGDTCLSDGYLSGATIECPLHQSCFDVRTGEVLQPPALDDVATYPVRVEGTAVLVEA